MPVDDEVDLRTISSEELEQIDREYEALEQKARDIENTKNKIKASMAEANAIAGGAPEDLGGTDNTGGIFGGTPKGIKGFQRSKGRAPGVAMGGDLLSGAGAPVQKEKFVEEVRRNSFELKKLQSQVSQSLQQGLGAVGDPLGFLKSGAIAQLAKFALPVGAAITIATMVYTLVKQQFGPGGLFDVRKLVRDEVREFKSLDEIVKLDRGEVYFATATSLTQNAPDFSNTETKVDGHLKDILRNAGY